MDAAQIKTVSNGDLCNTNARGAAVEAERQRRNLGDCSQAHLKCVNLNYQPGTAGYLQCRSMFAQADAVANAQALQTAAIVNQAVQAPPLAPLAPLPPLRQSVNCTSMAMGNMVNTTCN